MPTLADWVGNPYARGVLGRVGSEGNWSRIPLYLNTLQLIAERPWFGWGWGELAFAHYSTSFVGTWGGSQGRFMELLDNAHNLPLHLAVTLGVPVSLAVCGLVMWLIWRGKPWAERDPHRLMAWGILLVIGIHSMLEYPLWYGPFFMTALMCVVILLVPWVQSQVQNWPLARIQTAQRAIQLGAVALLIGTAYAAFDYHRVSQPYLQPEQRSKWYADDPYGHAAKSWLFRSHARFAELVVTPVSRNTAVRVYELSTELIHFSPEPRVIERLIESAVMLGHDEVAAFHIARYREAWPNEYAKWSAVKTDS